MKIIPFRWGPETTILLTPCFDPPTRRFAHTPGEAMKNLEYVLAIEGENPARSSQLAASLEEELRASLDHSDIRRTRSARENMDFGTTLAIVLGAPSVVVLAQALKNWLARNNSASVTIRLPDGSLIASNLESKDIANILREFSATVNKGRNAP
jgi:hypothetical protein